MRPPILIAFALLLAACGVKLDLERDILDGAENAVVWMTDLRDDIPLAHLSIPGAHDAASVSITSWPSYTRTQGLDIAGLWNCGVRAFDLRPSLVNGTMGIYHDKYSANVTFMETVNALLLALDQHPGECSIILIRHEVEADGNNPLWADEMGALLAGIRSRLVPYRSSLTLGDVRGKILLLSRDSFRGGPYGAYIHGWYSGKNLSVQKAGLLVDEDGRDSPFWVQDYYHPDGSEDKWEQVKGMLDAAASSPGSCPLIVNHVSGYTGTLPDYRANARNVNARAAEYIRSRDIPAGIVMMDFAGVDQSKGKDVGGALLVKTLIENNLKR